MRTAPTRPAPARRRALIALLALGAAGLWTHTAATQNRMGAGSHVASGAGTAAAGDSTNGAPAKDTDEDGQPAQLPPLPPEVTLDRVRAGDSLFHSSGGCFACHGADATGLPAAGSSLTTGLHFIPVDWRAIDSLVTAGIPDGITRSPIGMPGRGARGDLSDAQIRDLAAYVWAVASVRGEPWPGGHATHASMVPPGATTGTATAPLPWERGRNVTAGPAARAGPRQGPRP